MGYFVLMRYEVNSEMEKGTLVNKTVFITGASGGIGAEIARHCAEQGANLALFARSFEKLQKLKKELEESFSSKITVYRLDVSDTDQINEVFSRALEDFSGIDILVNNAGYGVFQYAHDATIEDIKGMFSVNVVGLIYCTRVVLPVMREQKSGHIINIASQAGKIATPKSSVYSASKHAVIGYSNALRMELADYNVNVTTVNPGPIETNFFAIADEKGTYVMNVKKYMLKPQYVARKVVNAMLTSKREINLPRWMNLGSYIYTLFPRLFEKVGKKAFNKK